MSISSVPWQQAYPVRASFAIVGSVSPGIVIRRLSHNHLPMSFRPQIGLENCGKRAHARPRSVRSKFLASAVYAQ